MGSSLGGLLGWPAAVPACPCSPSLHLCAFDFAPCIPTRALFRACVSGEAHAVQLHSPPALVTRRGAAFQRATEAAALSPCVTAHAREGLLSVYGGAPSTTHNGTADAQALCPRRREAKRAKPSERRGRANARARRGYGQVSSVRFDVQHVRRDIRLDFFTPASVQASAPSTRALPTPQAPRTNPPSPQTNRSPRPPCRFPPC